MKDITYNHYNSVMNLFKQCGDMYFGLAYAFKYNKYEGFYKFAMNEAAERWKYAKKIAKYLCTHEKQPKITASPEFSQDFQSMPTALQEMAEMDRRILSTINTAMIKQMDGKIDIWTLKKMSKLYEKCQKEYSEVASVKGKLALPGADVFSVDKWLYKKYTTH